MAIKAIKEFSDRELSEGMFKQLIELNKTLGWIKGFCIFLIVMTLLSFVLYFMMASGETLA